MGNRRSSAFAAPGMITLIQTSGDELNFNCHLHVLITDGVINSADPRKITFQRCPY
ncbi:MAG: transposase [Deltaproteobacteria bacterium]|nr:transposase [Deltaproteobacteria bacterium]